MLLLIILCGVVISDLGVAGSSTDDKSKVVVCWEKSNIFSEYPLNTMHYEKNGKDIKVIESCFRVCVDYKNIVSIDNDKRREKNIFIHRFYIINKKDNKVVYVSPWSIFDSRNGYIVKYNKDAKAIDVMWGNRLVSRLSENELKSEETPDLRILLDE